MVLVCLGFLLGYFASWFVFCGVECVWCLRLLLVVCFLVVGCCIFVGLCCFVLCRLVCRGGVCVVDVTLRFVRLGLGLVVVVFYYVWLVVCGAFALRWFV